MAVEERRRIDIEIRRLGVPRARCGNALVAAPLMVGVAARPKSSGGGGIATVQTSSNPSNRHRVIGDETMIVPAAARTRSKAP